MSETITEALSAMGRATILEISARMKIEPADLRKMLQEYEDSGSVECVNGYWSLVEATPAPARHVLAADKVPFGQPSISADAAFETIQKLLTENGQMGTADIAAKMDRHTRALNPIMHTLSVRGKVVRHGTGKDAVWSLPEKAVLDEHQHKADDVNDIANVGTGFNADDIQTTSPATEQPPEVTLIPKPRVVPINFHIPQPPEGTESSPDDLIIPSMSVIDEAITIARVRLAALEKVKEVVLELSLHKSVLRELVE